MQYNDKDRLLDVGFVSILLVSSVQKTTQRWQM